MTKKQIMLIRVQTWSAWTKAFNSGAPYSLWFKDFDCSNPAHK